MGIEPTSSAWEAEVLPLNYTRNFPSHTISAQPYRIKPVIGYIMLTLQKRTLDYNLLSNPIRNLAKRLQLVKSPRAGAFTILSNSIPSTKRTLDNLNYRSRINRS